VNSRFETGQKKNVAGSLIQHQRMLNWRWADDLVTKACTVQTPQTVTLRLSGFPRCPKHRRS
jgi:hypothetical protein